MLRYAWFQQTYDWLDSNKCGIIAQEWEETCWLVEEERW